MFSQLAPELILLIAGHIETERDLNSLVRVNHKFYQLLNNFRYKSNAERDPYRQYSKFFAILWAAQYGQEETLHHALAAGASPHTTDDDGQTPLIVAARYKQYSIVEILLQLPDANPNEDDNWGNTAFAWAAENGDNKLLQRLLKHPLFHHGLKIYRGHKYGTHSVQICATPLMRAAKNGHASTVKIILETGLFDPNISLFKHPAAILQAASNGHEAAFRELLAVPNIKLNEDILCTAIRGGNKQIVTLLLDANVDSRLYRHQIPPLHTAVETGDIEMVRLLIAKGANLNSADSRGRTALTVANNGEYEEIIELLKSLGCQDPIVPLKKIDFSKRWRPISLQNQQFSQ